MKIFLRLILCCQFFILYQKVAPAQLINNFYDINSVREIRIYFTETDWDHILDSLFLNYGENARLEGVVSIDNTMFNHVGIRYKGFSSWEEDQVKCPFNIELDYRHPNQNYQGFTKIKLSNVIRDPSFVREALSYEIARKYMPASRANFARVFVNDVYLGLYTNVEAVDKPFVKKNYNSDNHTFVKGSPATLVFPYGENSNLAFAHGFDSSGYIPYYKMESEYGWSNLYHLIDVLNNDTILLPSVLNIDRTLWMHAFNYTLLNLDSYIGYSQNYYLYEDDHGAFNPVVWDLNMSFGSFRNSDGTQLSLSIAKMKEVNPLGLLNSGSGLFSERPLIKNLINNGMYRRMFLAHMRTIINENIRNNEYYIRGKAMQDTIDYWVFTDTNKFYSNNYFLTNLDTTVGPTANQFPGIRDIMKGRLGYLDTISGFSGYPEISSVSFSPVLPQIGEITTLTLRSTKSKRVYLYYRNSKNNPFQTLPMFDDGLHNDGAANDSIFGLHFEVSGPVFQYYIYAENDSSGTFLPERAAYNFFSLQPIIEKGSVVINEISDEWIELYNPSSDDLNLADVFFSDDATNLYKWQFPDTTLASDQFLVLYSSDIIANSKVSLNFIIDPYGGNLFLSNKNHQIIDSISYSPVVSKNSVGRYPNGFGTWFYMPQTFNNYNAVGEPVSRQFKIYPNPTSGKAWAQIENNNESFEIKILNAEGQIILDFMPWYNANSLSETLAEIDLNDAPDGLYIIKVITSNEIMQKKLIKIK